MSFVGAIDSPLRAWLNTNADRWKGRTIFCGCSGNFTIEQLCAGGAGRIYSNDIGLYTHVIGENLVGRRAKVEVREDVYAWLRPFWEQDQAASMIVLFEALKFEKQQNFYTKRLWTAWRLRFADAFEKAVARVAEVRSRLNLTEFTSIDIGEFIERAQVIDPNGVMLNFLPTYASGYEKMYKRLEEILAWEPPKYLVIDAERKAALVKAITDRWSYVLYDDQPQEGLKSVMLRQRRGSKPVWLYSNLDVISSVVGDYRAVEASHHPRLTAADLAAVDAATSVHFVRVPQSKFDYFRYLYLAKGILPGACDICLFVFIGGKLAGFIGVSRSKYGHVSKGEVFLTADFAVPIPDGGRLSKLVLWLTRTHEVAELVADAFMQRVATITTGVFTERPSSMKYRGVYELKNRSRNDRGEQVLFYGAPAATHTIPEAIRQWLKSRPKSEQHSTL